MSTNDIISCWENGIEPYACAEPAEEQACNHDWQATGYSWPDGYHDKNEEPELEYTFCRKCGEEMVEPF